MKAHVQWVVGVIRGGPQFDKFGDPYTFACAVVVTDGEALMQGAVGKLGLAEARAIGKAIFESGVRFVRWDRIRDDGSIKSVRIDLQNEHGKNQTRQTVKEESQ